MATWWTNDIVRAYPKVVPKSWLPSALSQAPTNFAKAMLEARLAEEPARPDLITCESRLSPR